MSKEDRTVNQRLADAGIKTIRGFKDKKYGHTFHVLEFKGVSIRRPRICWLEDVQDDCRQAFGVDI